MKLLLPREHGAWGILLIPFLTAAAIAGPLTLPVWLALATVLLVFLARYPLVLLLVPGAWVRAGRPARDRVRRFAWLYSLLATGGGGLLIFVWELYLLVPLALAAALSFGLHLWLARRGAERGWAAELLGAAGLTLTALVGWVAATGGIDQTGFLVWLLNCVFFCAAVIYVKSRIRARRAAHRPEAGHESACSVGFHLLVVLFVGALVFLRDISPLIVVPFVVAAGRAGWGARRADHAFALRRLGWSEVALSLFFAGFLLLGFRL